MSASALIQLNVTGFGSDLDDSLTIDENSATSPLWSTPGYPFGTGDNVLTKPTGATQLIIRNVTGTVKLIGATGEVGYTLSTTYSTKLPVAGASIMFNATAGSKATLFWV